jgi:low temperature requirement protein LtrA
VAERYGLFTIIVLGESILAVSVGLREVIDASALVPAVLVAVVATLVVTFATWWLYFDTLGAQALVRGRRAAFAWGYGHYLVFAATAAIGAGVQAGLDSITGVEDAGGTGGARLVAASVAVVMLTVLALARISRPVPPTPLAAGAVLAGGLAAVAPVLGTAATLAAVAVVTAVAAGAQTAAVARQAEPNA